MTAVLILFFSKSTGFAFYGRPLADAVFTILFFFAAFVKRAARILFFHAGSAGVCFLRESLRESANNSLTKASG